MTSTNQNLFSALRAAFPADLDAIAIETADTPVPLYYSWRDLDRGTAMLANLIAALELPPASRIAVQVEKSVEALMLYLAVLRAGHVYLPLNTGYQAAEIEYFIGNAEPAMAVCAGRNFGWFSKLAFLAGTRHVFTLDDDRTGTLLDRAAQQIVGSAIVLGPHPQKDNQTDQSDQKQAIDDNDGGAGEEVQDGIHQNDPF